MKSSMISNFIATPVMGITCEDVHDDALELNKKIMPMFMWWIDEPSVKVRIPAQIGTRSAGKSTLVPIQIGTCSDANRHPV
jgi:hypothetical protein